jgi:hypothetical protein
MGGDPRHMHCQSDPRICHGESFCGCQCDKCRAAHLVAAEFYAPRAMPPHPLALSPWRDVRR